MASSLFFRAASWYWIARAALPNRPVRRRDVTSATMIGVLMSATLPARLGEPASALALARRTGRMRETFPVLLGTLVSQTMLNLVALALLGVIIVSTTPLFHSGTKKLFVFSLVPLLLLVVVLLAPLLMRRNGNGRLARLGAALHRALVQVRAGLAVFRDPRRGAAAAAAQLGAWAIQLAACWALLYALGLDGKAGIGAAAAVLFAVNVTAVVPGDAVEHRRLPARGDQRAPHRLRHRHRRRPRLRRDPPGGGDRDRRRPRPAGAGPRGPHLERPAGPGALDRAGAPRAEAPLSQRSGQPRRRCLGEKVPDL